MASRPCPICGKPATKEALPFCSDRCQTIDLGRWASGAYAIPVVEMDDLPDDENGTSPLDPNS